MGQYIGTLSNQTVVGTIQGCWILSTIMSLGSEGSVGGNDQPAQSSSRPKARPTTPATAGSSWAISSTTRTSTLRIDFMQMYRNVEFYNEILPATSAIATYTPGEGKAPTTLPGAPSSSTANRSSPRSVEDSARRPVNITGPVLLRRPRSAWHGDHQRIILQGGDVDTELATAGIR